MMRGRMSWVTIVDGRMDVYVCGWEDNIMNWDYATA